VSGFDGLMIKSVGLGEITLGRQSGEYSPPALCLALTAISSAISLEMMGNIGNFLLEGVGLERGALDLLLQCTSFIS
jgi:hypothetical protein